MSIDKLRFKIIVLLFYYSAEISNLTIQTTSQGFLHGTTGVEMSIVCSVCGGIPLRNLSMELDVEEEVVFNTSGRNLYYTFIPDATMHLMNITCRGYDILFEKSIKESITLNITCKFLTGIKVQSKIKTQFASHSINNIITDRNNIHF